KFCPRWVRVTMHRLWLLSPTRTKRYICGSKSLARILASSPANKKSLKSVENINKAMFIFSTIKSV
ncbi:MAG: hypothetical protein ACXU9L_03250, partial [Thermodesulfobacteriota bacterium]